MRIPSRLWMWGPVALILGTVSFCTGYLARAAQPEPEKVADAGSTEIWYCPMHPHLTSPDFARCPDCGMDMVKGEVSALPAGTVALGANARRLAEVRTAPVERRALSRELRMVGHVDYDETRQSVVTTRVAGWLERLYVDAAGISVREGDHLVSVYSPELLTAQQELLAAKQFVQGDAAVASARTKLRLMGLTSTQIEQIETRGTADDHVLLHAPRAGVVIEKPVAEGDHVNAGSVLYRIADLSRLWLKLYAYERDLTWIRYGQRVEVQTDAHPGRSYHGWVSFIDPQVDQETRTVALRVQLDNTEGTLKPGMLARAHVQVRLAADGKVMAPELAGKWISPMHPEIVKDEAGSCDVCGMPLVKAEELGYVTVTQADQLPIVVPASAVLRTGRRAVVYVETAAPDAGMRYYRAREIALGPRTDDHYMVADGLEVGEQVVVHGAFKIDSELQIRTQGGMMAAPGEGAWLGTEVAAFRRRLTPLYDAYFAAQHALAADEAESARAALERLHEALAVVPSAALPRAAIADWRPMHQALSSALREVLAAPVTLVAMRGPFRPLSHVFVEIERTFGHAEDRLVREVYCPMAFGDTGGSWLQLEDQIANPYYGAEMLRCGDILGEHGGLGGR